MRQYVSLRGENSLYVGAVHRDREHIHMHVVMSGVQYLTGKSNRISRQQFQEVKVAMQEYQMTKYPELKNSLPEHNKARNLSNREQASEKNINAERTSDKNTLLELLETTYSNSNSVEHFLNQISLLGHKPYYRNGRLQGIKYNNERKFRFKPLGYDTEKLEGLNRKAKEEERSLDEIANLRSRGLKREISKDNESTQRQTSLLTNLEELEALRSHAAEGTTHDPSDSERTDNFESDTEDVGNDYSADQNTSSNDFSEYDNLEDEESNGSETDDTNFQEDVEPSE